MTDANPRDLIRRLSKALNDLSEHLEAETPAPTVQNAHKAWKEARAYLDQSEPEAPTVMEIIALADEIEEEGLGQVDLVRRALARWGTCPYIVSSDEGTSYCRLAEQS